MARVVSLEEVNGSLRLLMLFGEVGNQHNGT